MFDFQNLVQEFEAELGIDTDANVEPVILFDHPPVIVEDDDEIEPSLSYWDPGMAMRNNAAPRGPAPIGVLDNLCDGNWCLPEDMWYALIGPDPVALPFCCNATETLRQTIVRIRDFGPNKYRYDAFDDAITVLIERHYLPADNVVYELKARLEEWCYDQEAWEWQ